MGTPCGVHSTTGGLLAGGVSNGYKDGPALQAQFKSIASIAENKTTGAIYISDTSNNRIRRLLNGVVDTFAGSGGGGECKGGPAKSALIEHPRGIAFDSKKSKLYISACNSIWALDL